MKSEKVPRSDAERCICPNCGWVGVASAPLFEHSDCGHLPWSESALNQFLRDEANAIDREITALYAQSLN